MGLYLEDVMSGRAVFSAIRLAQVALLLAMSTPPAWALELVWSTGSRAISMPASGRCTLLVLPTRQSESLPREWRLSWTAQSEGSVPLRIEAVNPLSGFADVCTMRVGATPAGLAAHADTALHCTQSGVRETRARYVVDVEGGAVVRIKLVLAEDVSSTDSSLPLVDDSLEVTVNGGEALPYPPLVLTAQHTRAGSWWNVTLTGSDLDRVTSARYRAGAASTAFEVVQRSRGTLMARAEVTSVPEGGLIEVLNRDGFTAAVEIAPGSVPLPWVPDRFLVRFTTGSVEPIQGLIDAAPEQFSYQAPHLQDSLSAVGVTRLRRLLPWFQHEDVNSVNLAGESVVLEDLADLYVAEVGSGSDIANVSERVDRFHGVRYACPDWIFRSFTPPPNDQYFGDQWGLFNTGQQPCGYPGLPGRDIDALHAWDVETGKPYVRVGILDTGILAAHPDLFPRVVLDTTFVLGDPGGGSDDSGNRHGTGVAGIVGASTGNSIGVAGVARGVSLWSIKVCEFDGDCTSSSILGGIDRARMEGIPIVNMSLGGFGIDSPALNEACLNAYLAGMFLVAASGNAEVQFHSGSQSFSEEIFQGYPAAYHRRVFAVGAFMNDGRRWVDSEVAENFCKEHPFDGACLSSNYGLNGDPWMDVIAPGGRYIVTTRDTAAANRYSTLANCQPGILSANTGFGGTSSAAPVVSGVAALLKSRHFGLTGEDMEQLIIRTTIPPPGGFDFRVGYGRLRAGAALAKIESPNFAMRDSLRATAQQLVVVDSTVLYGRRFIDVFEDPLQDYTTSCVRYRLRGTWAFNPPFLEIPWAWIRGSGTLGWRDTVTYDQNYEVPGGRVVSISADSAVFETNVYRIRDSQDTTVTLGWYPTVPAQARVGATAVGLKSVVGVDEAGGHGDDFAVLVRPNPIRRGAWIDLSLPHAGIVNLEIFDLTGRRVATLLRGPLGAGRHSIAWNGRATRPARTGAGVYYMRCGFGGREIVRKLVLLGVAP